MIHIISLEQTFPVRSAALRSGKPYEFCIVPEDAMTGSFHLGFMENECCLGVASFYPVSREDLQGKGFQLRLMGVLPELQGKGIGSDILSFGIEMLKKTGSTHYLWCNAREKAFSFYERLGFEYISKSFDIAGIGPHKTMLLLF
jgi:GNAT superfamily N-acetyltransferase